MRPPLFREHLEVRGNGQFRLWRSVATASDPPAPVGRFAGSLPPGEIEALNEAGRRAAGEGPRTWLISPDSPVDWLAVDDATAVLGIHDAGDGAWAALADLMRPLLADLTRSPVAAIALELDGGARLAHRGTESIEIDLSDLVVRAVHWRDGQSEARWTAPRGAEGVVGAGPGWSLAVPLEHGFDLEAGDRVTVSATFAARDGDEMVPVGLLAYWTGTTEKNSIVKEEK